MTDTEIYAVSLAIVAFCGLASPIITYFLQKATNKALDKNTEISKQTLASSLTNADNLEIVHNSMATVVKQTNGLTDKLVDLAKISGKAEGIVEQKERQTAIDAGVEAKSKTQRIPIP
jgi:deferrochelatase/peroxidase EfeB